MTDEPPASHLDSPHHRSTRPIRRPELRRLVPLSDTTIYELERNGDFPRRFRLTPRCVVWDLAEVEAWITNRRRASEDGSTSEAPIPDVRRRRNRTVKVPEPPLALKPPRRGR